MQRSNDAAQKDAQTKTSTEECAEDMEQKEHALPMVVQTGCQKGGVCIKHVTKFVI